jgi:hypothetical protein
MHPSVGAFIQWWRKIPAPGALEPPTVGLLFV